MQAKKKNIVTHSTVEPPDKEKDPQKDSAMEDITDTQKPEDVEEMDDIDNKVDLMAMEDEGGKDNTEMILPQPNSKVHSSIPIDTKQHQLMDDIKAAQFWQQVIQKQQDTNVKLPSGLINESKKKNTYVEYTEEEWNE
eukprot:9881456-Ditylum_brightwellii.AAC.1